MSKYIRTKSYKFYIFKVADILNDGRVKAYLYANPHLKRFDHIFEAKDIVSQADTIEELCDEAVFFDEQGKPHYKSCTPFWELDATLYKNTVRYCIFTDSGIIYVAKYNKDGMLELI